MIIVSTSSFLLFRALIEVIIKRFTARDPHSSYNYYPGPTEPTWLDQNTQTLSRVNS